MNCYWGKIKRDSQHQLEEVLDWAVHLEHLLAVLQEFDPAATPNKEIMIRYFREGLKPSIRTHMDARGRDLDSWEEAVEKTVNVEAKVSLQSPASTRDIDSRCLQGNKLTKKKEKDSRNKSTNSTPADTSSGKQSSSTQQTSSPHPKKGGPRRRRAQGQDSPITGVNAILKKEEVDLSQVDCFTTGRRTIMQTGILRKRRNKSQKTSISLGDLHVND